MNVIAYTKSLHPITYDGKPSPVIPRTPTLVPRFSFLTIIEYLLHIQTDYFGVASVRVNIITGLIGIATILLILNTLYWLIRTLKKQKKWVESVIHQLETQHKQQTAELTKITDQLRSELDIHRALYHTDIFELNQLLHAKTIQIEEFTEAFARTNREIEYIKGVVANNAGLVEVTIKDSHKKIIEQIKTQLNAVETKGVNLVKSSMKKIETQLGMVESTAKQNVEQVSYKIYSLQQNICNSDIHIGYKTWRNDGSNSVIPVFESPKITQPDLFNNSNSGYDCIIIRQLSFLRNITEIDIMSVVNITFMFDNVGLNELYSIGNKQSSGSSRGGYNTVRYISRIVEENNPNYVVLFRELLSDSDERFEGRMRLFTGAAVPASIDNAVRAYMKNGIRKLYERLRDIQIELIMPSELRDFVLHT